MCVMWQIPLHPRARVAYKDFSHLIHLGKSYNKNKVCECQKLRGPMVSSTCLKEKLVVYIEEIQVIYHLKFRNTG